MQHRSHRLADGMAEDHDIVLHTHDGTPVRLGDLAADPLVVVLVRYFGCLPCQAFVQELDAVRDQLPPGASVVAVGGSADFQAEWLKTEKGVGMPLLLDPGQHVRDLVQLGDLSATQLLSGRGMASYAGALVGKGLRPQKITKDATKAPGVALFDPDFGVRWVHRGERIGDYPTVEELLSVVRTPAGR